MKTSYVESSRVSRGKVMKADEEGQVLIQLPLPVADLMVDMQAEVEALATECGLLLMQACVESEVDSLAGPRYARDAARRATRAGRAGSWGYFAGRKVCYQRQRVRAEREKRLASVAAFQKDGGMQRAVASKVVSGVKMRRYGECLDAVCEGYGIKKSSVSRHWVKASAESLKELAERPLGGLDLVALVIDGVRFRDVLVVVALGVDLQGHKHVLGLYPGATENQAACQGLLDDLVRRGLDRARNYLFVIDGSKALRGAIRSTFGSEAPVQRCQVHKRRNVKDHVARSYQRALSLRLSAAYGMAQYADARAELEKVVKWLEEISPTGADSLREGLEETLTLHRLGVPALLRRSLSSTNLIESCFASTRERSQSVKRWRSQDQVMRWAGTMLLEAQKRFRRVRGHEAMPILIAKLGLKPVDEQEAVA